MKHKAEQFNLPLSTGYPAGPGYKNKDKKGPSRQAALSIKSHAVTLRDKCFKAVNQKPMTADEVANVIGASILSVRPRVAELVKLRRLKDTGLRRANSSGKMATVWGVMT